MTSLVSPGKDLYVSFFYDEDISNLNLASRVCVWKMIPTCLKFNNATQTQWDIFDTKIFKGKSVPFLLAEPKLPLAGGGSCFSKKGDLES